MALATDLGFVSEEVCRGVSGADLLICETNHDVDWLRSGPYPYYLQQRILGDRGHLSNEDAAAFARRMAECGTRCIVLAHLSRENNTPDIARQTAVCGMQMAGVENAKDYILQVAPIENLTGGAITF